MFTKSASKISGTSLIFSLLIVSVSAAVSYILDQLFLPQIGTLLILQLGVVTVALTSDRAISVFAALLSALIFNYFFTEPRYSLHMTEADDILNMLIFLIIAFITGHLAIHYRHQREELKQAQLRSSILFSVSHDLRTPLSTIIGTLDTLQTYHDKLSAAEHNELIEAALDESHRLHRYIENILQATKFQHGEVKLKLSKQSIKPLIEQVVARCESSRIETALSAELPDMLLSASLFEQALFNLIDNALQHSKNQAAVKIYAHRTSADQPVYQAIDQTSRHNNAAEFLDIFVEDSGEGIPHGLRQKVFDLFYSTRKRDNRKGGIGLGLSVASAIIQAHQGSIAIMDTTKGCTMRLRLPIPKEQAA